MKRIWTLDHLRHDHEVVIPAKLLNDFDASIQSQHHYGCGERGKDNAHGELRTRSRFISLRWRSQWGISHSICLVEFEFCNIKVLLERNQVVLIDIFTP